jgi:hypothetical protein
VLVDLNDVIVHVMLPRVREFYGLEGLWDISPDKPGKAGKPARPAKARKSAKPARAASRAKKPAVPKRKSAPRAPAKKKAAARAKR